MSYFGIPIRNGLPIGLGSVAPLASGGGSPFSPLSLFSGGAPGAWYDPSDLTTLFQDSAGTTPVTAVEQPVGRMLDKSGYGNHAFQATSASRPVLSARYNLLTKTEDFNDAVWVKTGATVTPNDITAPDGTLTADKVVFSGGTSEIYQAAGAGGAGALEAVGAVWVKGTAGETVQIYDAYTPRTPTTLTGNWQRLLVPVTGSIRYLDISAANGATARTIYIWGASLVPANQSTLPYQRVNTATDYNTTGFLPYLKFDGVDDSLSTNSISFTATDKMSVFAGARRIGSTLGMLAELSSAGNSGSFYLAAPYSGSQQLGYVLNGTATSGYVTTTLPASATEVVSIAYDIGGTTISDEIKPRVNGAIPSLTVLAAGPAGTGNFGNYPLFIGRRNNATLPFNGQMYSMVIVGKAVTAGELTSTETYVNQKTGAY